MIVNDDCNHSFIVLATVITFVNYNCKTFIVQATGKVAEKRPNENLDIWGEPKTTLKL
jgi:hypothetical protein